jgi:hypothetical protein
MMPAVRRAWRRITRHYPSLVCRTCGYRVPYLGDRYDQCRRALDHTEALHTAGAR